MQQIIDLITLHPNQRVFIGVDSLGKENMLVALANHFKTLVRWREGEGERRWRRKGERMLSFNTDSGFRREVLHNSVAG